MVYLSNVTIGVSPKGVVRQLDETGDKRSSPDSIYDTHKPPQRPIKPSRMLGEDVIDENLVRMRSSTNGGVETARVLTYVTALPQKIAQVKIARDIDLRL